MLMMPIPFDEEQLEMITGANGRRDFYLEDDVVQEATPDFQPLEGWHDTGRTRDVAGEEIRVQHPDIVPSGVDWLDKGREKLWGGMYRAAEPVADFLTEAVTPRTESGIGGMITQAESKPSSVAEAQARGQKTFWVNGKEKLAVTREQLGAFMDSEAYDPNSGRSALSQWSAAWQSPEVAPDAPQAPRRDVRDILIEEEGLELTPYTDPGRRGGATVGVGHQLRAGEEERDISEAEARETLEVDISEAYAAVDRLTEKFDVGEIPSELRDELMMMAFQMGATGLSKFKKMWGAMKNQDWAEMVAQMADSRWAKSQTPERAARTINRVATLFGV